MELSRDELLARIAMLEAGRKERKIEQRAERKRSSYFKTTSYTNDQFNKKFRGKRKGQQIVTSVGAPAESFAEKRVSTKMGWSKRNGKRA